MTSLHQSSPWPECAKYLVAMTIKNIPVRNGLRMKKKGGGAGGFLESGTRSRTMNMLRKADLDSQRLSKKAHSKIETRMQIWGSKPR